MGIVIHNLVTADGKYGAITAFLAAGTTGHAPRGMRFAETLQDDPPLVIRTDLPRNSEFFRTVNFGAFSLMKNGRYVNEGLFHPQGQGVPAGVPGGIFMGNTGTGSRESPRVWRKQRQAANDDL